MTARCQVRRLNILLVDVFFLKKTASKAPDRAGDDIFEMLQGTPKPLGDDKRAKIFTVTVCQIMIHVICVHLTVLPPLFHQGMVVRCKHC